MPAEPTPRPVNAMASGSPAAVTEPNASTSSRMATTTPASSPVPPIACCALAGSSPPSSAWRPCSCAGAMARSSGSRPFAPVRSGSVTGTSYVTVSRAVSPSSERRGGVTWPACGTSASRWARSLTVGPVERGAVPVVDDDLGLGATAARDVVPEHLDAALGAGARHVVVVLGGAAERRRRRDRDADHEQPGGDRAPGVGRGAVAEAVEDA